MVYTFEHNNKIYAVDTTPKYRDGTPAAFATVEELIPRKATGVIANFLHDYTGQEQWTYDHCGLREDDLVEFVLDQGYKAFRSKAWKNLYSWAYYKRTRNHSELDQADE